MKYTIRYIISNKDLNIINRIFSFFYSVNGCLISKKAPRVNPQQEYAITKFCLPLLLQNASFMLTTFHSLENDFDSNYANFKISKKMVFSPPEFSFAEDGVDLKHLKLHQSLALQRMV